MATVPVFNVKAQILSILDDVNIICDENFANGLDIFTGIVCGNCEPNNCYGEIHTGNAWNSAREKFCGNDGKYMPFGMVIFVTSHTY